MLPRLPQDLHVHTTWSSTDGAIDPRQTVELVASVRHALILGVSDHLEAVADCFAEYARAIRGHGLLLGTEVDGVEWAPRAVDLPVDYFVYHCRNRAEDYRGAELLLATGKPLIIAHPQLLDTEPQRLPPGCLIEINNRYVWQRDGEPLFAEPVAASR